MHLSKDMPKTAQINMRVDPSQFTLLTRAAAAIKKDRSAFILEAACREAENLLLDQRLFLLDEESFTAFIAALDAPITDDAELKTLLTEPSPWED